MKFHRILSASLERRLKAHLKLGGLVAYPTESCYGLGCLPTLPSALKHLIRLKKRPQHKGLIVIGDSLTRLLPLLCKPSAKQQAELVQTWPAAKTFLLPARENVLPVLRGKGRQKLAVRVPAHSGARRLCRAVGAPLVSTSCNRAGKRVCKTEREVRRQFGRKVWVIGGLVGRQKTPSQIIDGETGTRLR
ncbi:L-threonylcarbamoyladenylate synthase [Neisseria animalis]|uniref:Threonylcarbamoyl-AMP synthase n=1 Tax=Neisseria animalis TaxID=492 RepID=A0A5P3MQL8_NEIAN|nr:L-threonylcarbamoyladenylate synthase [Neisseria animalis]QEY23892.1 Sua5/YciO/YrdC/YwlC family protein [Neisseria animalis]ROW32040.1 Sua5/YciO/YrdC/YwlC family protein [Neisseria animalis]VEE05802.1 putative translation factor [Neisseria animalis]